MNSFSQYVQQLLSEYPNERIRAFEFEGKKYWLKQPEQLSFLWRLLKSDPQKSFQKEIRALQNLNHCQAPVPAMPLYDRHFIVLEDVGESVSQHLNNAENDDEKLAILLDCARELFQFHQRGLIHGRPAVRDMLWRDGHIFFIDFENYHPQSPTDYLKVKDMLIFIYSLCREESISNELLLNFLQAYQQRVPTALWDRLRKTLTYTRWVYYLLFPFKLIAKKDLRAVYRLFENFAHSKD